MEAGDGVDLALDPAGVIGGGAGSGSEEELLVGGAEAANVDDEAVMAGDGEFVEDRAELPGYVGVEAEEVEGLLLVGDAGEVVGGGGHGRNSKGSGGWESQRVQKTG